MSKKNETQIRQAIATKLNEYRIANRYSHKEMAGLLHVKLPTYFKYIEMKCKPSFVVMYRIEQLLGQSIFDIAGVTERC